MMCASLGLAPAGQHPLDRADVDAVGLELDHAHVGAAVAQRQQRPVVGRPLDDHRVAGLDQRVEQERVGLHRAVGDQHPLGLDLVALGDPFAQRHVPDRRPVGGDAGRVLVERLLRGGAQSVDVDDVQGRGAAGEGDRVSHAPETTQLTRARLHFEHRPVGCPRSRARRPRRPRAARAARPRSAAATSTRVERARGHGQRGPRPRARAAGRRGSARARSRPSARASRRAGAAHMASTRGRRASAAARVARRVAWGRRGGARGVAARGRRGGGAGGSDRRRRRAEAAGGGGGARSPARRRRGAGAGVPHILGKVSRPGRGAAAPSRPAGRASLSPGRREPSRMPTLRPREASGPRRFSSRTAGQGLVATCRLAAPRAVAQRAGAARAAHGGARWRGGRRADSGPTTTPARRRHGVATSAGGHRRASSSRFGIRVEPGRARSLVDHATRVRLGGGLASAAVPLEVAPALGAPKAINAHRDLMQVSARCFRPDERAHAPRRGADSSEAEQSKRAGAQTSRRRRMLGHLGRGAPDAHARALERLGLGLGRARGAGDDRAGVAHGLARRAR